MKISLVMVLLVMLTFDGFGKTSVTVYCDDSYSPYSYQEGSEARGIYVEILKKIFDKMDEYDVEIKANPWKRGLSYVETGKGFAIFPPYYNEDRAKWGIYSDPILEEEVVVCGMNGKQAKIENWPSDVHGKKFGLNNGFTLGGKEFWDDVKAGKIIIEEAKSNSMNLGKLNLGRVDYYMNDKYAILWELTKMKAQGEIPQNTNADVLYSVSKENGYLMFAKNGDYPYRNDFIKKFNTVLNEMKNNGEITKVVSEYIK
ncbi:MAG: transporter substrate-binding domain-containing protein [Candidatus Delongbacteria bacterium]|nr:transporter substrate-binding domain-containing protein [Candidatus Delongbacteria bacterium]MBN2834582.1 transporter substrate-binding domain-containing protein [Candidatus Delongbacteria bacterium]